MPMPKQKRGRVAARPEKAGGVDVLQVGSKGQSTVSRTSVGLVIDNHSGYLTGRKQRHVLTSLE